MKRTPRLGVVWLLCGLLLPAFARAADARPIVGPGATKEEILDAYGWPTGQSQAGDKEILTYPQGRVVLEKGKVETVDFSLNVPWPPPRPRPGTAVAGSGDSWYTNWPEALKEAKRRQTRILVLFVGSDWSPPSHQFLTEVAESPDFLTAFWGTYVLLKLDYPKGTTQVKALRTQNAELREQFEVTTYPALLILESDGRLAMRIDLSRSYPGDTYRAQVIAAVREARAVLSPGAAGAPAARKKVGAAGVPAPDTAPIVPSAPATRVDAAATADTPEPISFWSASRALVFGMGGGIALAVALVWIIWRMRPTASAVVSTAAARVAEAGSGLPALDEMAAWPHERLRAVVAVLAECNDYTVAVRSGGSEGDLGLSHRGEPQVAVIVSCTPGSAGTISAKRLRELFGTVTMEGARTGWFVSMAGFSNEARQYAQTQGLSLVNRDALREQMRGLLAQDLAKVMRATK